MNLDNCFICKRPVLEFEGQFDKLDTYLLNESDDAYQQGAFGWCHARCLSTSNWGAFWAQRRIHHMTEVMGFAKSSEIGALTAIRNPLSKLVEALNVTDCLLYPEAILDGMMQFDKTLKQHWMGNWVSAMVAYNQFVPQAVVDLVTSASTL
jgi:hypothetical protein